MIEADNLTPFAFDTAFAYDVAGAAMVVLCVAGRFGMPPADRPSDAQLPLSPEQRPPSMADVHWGDPSTSSLRFAGQGLAHRLRPEIYLNGSAWSLRGRPGVEVATGVRVGGCVKQVNVTGDRRWTRGPLGLRASKPDPFVQMPLVYERAFGGTTRDEDRLVSQHPGNPVGCGAYPEISLAVDQPLPNLEPLRQRMNAWDESVEVCCFGPIPASWQPRLGYAGTYDERWAEERAPFWPVDVKPQFFAAAASGLLVAGPLSGGDVVRLEGFSPDGGFAFRLPSCRIVAKSYYGDRVTRGMLTLEGLLLEPDERAVTLIWRRTVPLGHGPRAHLNSIVRLLEPWEDVSP